MSFRAACLVSLLVLACEPDPGDVTADRAVREFVEIARGFQGDERDARSLFDLLSQRAQSNLSTRAERYGAASGKQIAPWAMLVPARMAPKFAPQAYRAQVVGQYALVDVVGVGTDEVAQVPCVLEEGLWRLDLVLPELPAMRRRPGSGQ